MFQLLKKTFRTQPQISWIIIIGTGLCLIFIQFRLIITLKSELSERNKVNSKLFERIQIQNEELLIYQERFGLLKRKIEHLRTLLVEEQDKSEWFQLNYFLSKSFKKLFKLI